MEFPNTLEGIKALIKILPKNAFVLFDLDDNLQMLQNALSANNIPCSCKNSKSVLTAIWLLTKNALKFRIGNKDAS